MAGAFERVIRLQMSRASPEAARLQHIAIARQRLAEFMARQDVRPMVSLEVDGRPAASEEAVRPFGRIVYRFNRMREVLSLAKTEAERLSPVRSGRYRRSWIVLANNEEIGMDAIPHGVPIVLTNFQPYSRKINLGTRGYEKYAPPGVVEKVRMLVLQRYRPIVDARVAFLELAGGVRVRATKKARARPMTYPSLIITPKV